MCSDHHMSDFFCAPTGASIRGLD